MFQCGDRLINRTLSQVHTAYSEVCGVEIVWMINHLRYTYHFIGVNRRFGELATVRKKKYQLITRSDRGKKHQAEAFVYLIAYE